MNALDEAITKAQQTAELLLSDILQAHGAIMSGPEGMSRRDYALQSYLAECLHTARMLRSKLDNLGPA